MEDENPFNSYYYPSSELRKMGFKHIGDNVTIAKNCTIIGLRNISIGNNVRIDGNVTLACSNGQLNIGNFIHIGGLCHLACGGGIDLGDFSGLSQGVKIYSSSDDYSGNSLTNPTIPKEFLNVTYSPVVIDRHVIVGSGSVVLPGITIGEGSSVGALSLVTKSLAAWGVYCGIPAKMVKTRSKSLLSRENTLLQHLADEI